jgi:hypothetical protein
MTPDRSVPVDTGARFTPQTRLDAMSAGKESSRLPHPSDSLPGAQSAHVCGDVPPYGV